MRTFLLPLFALAFGCASAPEAPTAIARSQVGPVTVADLERYSAERPAVSPRSPELDLRAAEAIVAERAAVAEALAERLDQRPEFAARLRVEKEAILVRQMRERARLELDGAVALDEAAIAVEVEARRRRQTFPERLRLRQIFLRVPAHATPEERQAARVEMEGILARLAAGDDFSELARRHSDSQTASFGGLVAPVAPADLPPELAAKLAALAVGETSPILESAAGLQLFRLEERLPAVEPPPAATLEPSVRSQLRERELARLLREREAALLRSVGGEARPEALALSTIDPGSVVFDDGRRRLIAGDVIDRWRSLPFLKRRAESLRSISDQEASRLVWLRAAEEAGLDRDAKVARELAASRRAVLEEAALARRAERLGPRIPVEELRQRFETRPGHRLRPAAIRIRALIRQVVDPRGAIALADELDLVARRIRAGELDLEEEIRSSSDPSRLDGGDLGWAEARELAVWGGDRLSTSLMALAPGEISAPILVETYDDRRLRYDPAAYLVARVEEVRPERRPAFEEVVEAVRAEAVAARDGWLGESLKRELLESVEFEPVPAR